MQPTHSDQITCLTLDTVLSLANRMDQFFQLRKGCPLAMGSIVAFGAAPLCILQMGC